MPEEPLEPLSRDREPPELLAAGAEPELREPPPELRAAGAGELPEDDLERVDEPEEDEPLLVGRSRVPLLDRRLALLGEGLAELRSRLELLTALLSAGAAELLRLREVPR